MAKRGRPPKEQPVTDITPEPETEPVPGAPEPGPNDELQGHQPALEQPEDEPADQPPAEPAAEAAAEPVPVVEESPASEN
jgi:hypothetical protein